MIERMFIRLSASGLPLELARAEVVAGAGLRGDRYFGARDEPGQNITFVEAEAIEAFAALGGGAPAWAATGRNVVTRGVRLNELVGREFTVGAVRLRGVDRCDPCLTLGEVLADGGLTAAAVVRHWVGRGGLRADVLADGTLGIGDAFDAGPPMASTPAVPAPMLHHLSLGVLDVARAARLYDAALAPLGYVRVWSDLRPGERGQAAGYGIPGGGDKLALKQVDRPAPDVPGFHVALHAPTRDAVAAFHAAALACGGRDHGAPGLRPHYGPDYFAAFVVDLDGYRLEAVCKARVDG